MISNEQKLSNLRSILIRKQKDAPRRDAILTAVAEEVGLKLEPNQWPDYDGLLEAIQAMETRGASAPEIIETIRKSIEGHWKDLPAYDQDQGLALGYKWMSRYFNDYLEGIYPATPPTPFE